MKPLRQLYFGLLLLSSFTYAQDGVGIGTTDVPKHAILNIEATNKGIIFPSASSDISVTTDPTKHVGMFYYNTTTKALHRWDQSWVRLINTGSDADVKTVTSDGAITAKTGNITATVGNLVASNGNITAVKGDISATTGNITAGGTVSGVTLSGSNATITSNVSTASLSASSTITATGNVRSYGEFIGNGIIPKGGIIMWSGTTVPSGWALCDGTNGTPNLKNKFIMGSSTKKVGNVRVVLDNISSDYINNTTECSPYSTLYTESGFYYDDTAKKELAYSFSNYATSSFTQARNDKITGGTWIRFVSQSTSPNGKYYLTNANCHQAAQYYEMAFIMRID